MTFTLIIYYERHAYHFTILNAISFLNPIYPQVCIDRHNHARETLADVRFLPARLRVEHRLLCNFLSMNPRSLSYSADLHNVLINKKTVRIRPHSRGN